MTEGLALTAETLLLVLTTVTGIGVVVARRRRLITEGLGDTVGPRSVLRERIATGAFWTLTAMLLTAT